MDDALAKFVTVTYWRRGNAKRDAERVARGQRADHASLHIQGRDDVLVFEVPAETDILEHFLAALSIAFTRGWIARGAYDRRVLQPIGDEAARDGR